MINSIIKLMTKKKRASKCLFCKKEFIGEIYKLYHKGMGFINVADCYCSKSCERAMSKAIKKVFNRKILSRQEKLAVKDLRYIDI